jgi:hypothetical protein
MTGLSEQDNIEACELLIDHLNSKGTVQRLKIIRWLNDMARRVENAMDKNCKDLFTINLR